MNIRSQIPAQIITFALLLHSFPVQAIGLSGLRCLCFESVNAVRPKMMKNFEIFPKSVFCSQTEVILTVTQDSKDMEVCLRSDSKQGTRLQRCWKRIQNDPKKKNVCIRRLLRKGRKGRRRKGRSRLMQSQR
ncbi:C-X-C motif chemokine 5-like [Narcine bancroftii]|uniref:C-X-C motif chemokine 5-like n=1 Tax=Narcine bancroftii TaxID=1343680 RepID=UPI003831C0BC